MYEEIEIKTLKVSQLVHARGGIYIPIYLYVCQPDPKVDTVNCY